jgi:chemotaxis protein histidine kinase CheA
LHRPYSATAAAIRLDGFSYTDTLKCLLVDGLLHRQEVVIKNVGQMIRQRNASIAGAAILGDGRVGLILDVNSLGSLPVSHCAQMPNN